MRLVRDNQVRPLVFDQMPAKRLCHVDLDQFTANTSPVKCILRLPHQFAPVNQNRDGLAFGLCPFRQVGKNDRLA